MTSHPVLIQRLLQQKKRTDKRYIKVKFNQSSQQNENKKIIERTFNE